MPTYPQWEPTTRLLFAQLVLLQEWWLLSEEELQIKAPWRILGVFADTEMEDGTGSKLHTKLELKNLSLAINIQPCLLELLWLCLEEEPTPWERTFSLKYTRLKAVNGRNSTHCKDSDIQFGQLIQTFSCMEDLKTRIQTSQQTLLWNLTWPHYSKKPLLYFKNWSNVLDRKTRSLRQVSQELLLLKVQTLGKELLRCKTWLEWRIRLSSIKLKLKPNLVQARQFTWLWLNWKRQNQLEQVVLCHSSQACRKIRFTICSWTTCFVQESGLHSSMEMVTSLSEENTSLHLLKNANVFLKNNQWCSE